MDKKRTARKVTFIITYIFLGLLLVSVIKAPLQAAGESDKDILNRAKVALFDRKWDRALDYLDQLMKEYPKTPYYNKVLFYRGQCWANKKDAQKALGYYREFIETTQNEALKVEALVATIDLNFTLYTKGKRGYADKIVELLDSDIWEVRNYAAFKLSYALDKKIAAKAVPVLKRMIREEDEPALVDRARIALMRIDPKHLKQLNKQKNKQPTTLSIRVYNETEDKEVFSLNIPFSLARLALEALPDDQKKMLKKRGHDLEGIIDTLIKDMEPIRIKSEDVVIEIDLK